jgi:hypothetical protein
MKRCFILAAAACLATSCIVSDQITTLTILPDGSADWVRFQSNIRSTEKGEKGAEELRRFVEDFDGQRDPDIARIRSAGGEVLESRWVRRQEPYATLVVGRLPGSKALESFFTIPNEKGEPEVEARFSRNGERRRLTLAVSIPREEVPQTPRPTEAERRREEANGLSETRIAVGAGRILEARGFAVAEDRRSALLDPAEVLPILHAGGGKAEFFLEWDLAGN